MSGYYVRVYDNYHYMDPDEAYDVGPFQTAEEALETARRIVRESVRSMIPGCETVEDVMSQYKTFGDDPVVLGAPPVAFSAWEYALQFAITGQ